MALAKKKGIESSYPGGQGERTKTPWPEQRAFRFRRTPVTRS